MYPSCGKILSSTRIVFHSSAIRMPSAGCVPSVISNLAFQCWIFICNPLVLRTTFYSKEIFSVCLTKTSMRGGGFLWWTDPEQYSFFFGFQRIVLSSKGRHVRIYMTPSFCPSVRIIHHLLLFCFVFVDGLPLSHFSVFSVQLPHHNYVHCICLPVTHGTSL